MLLILVALFVIGPIAEIAVLLAAGDAFGVLPVVAACIATAIIGGVLLRIQGFAAIRSAQNNMADGKIPVEAAVDGVFLAIAAPFLMTPGFLTDIVGFSLLVPPVRRLLARAALNRFRRAVERGDATITVRRF